MKKKWLWICITFLIVLIFTSIGCDNESGDSDSPSINSFQDAQIDTGTTEGNVRADSPKVILADGSQGGRIYTIWVDYRYGDRNVFFNCKNVAGNWEHGEDLQLDKGFGYQMAACDLQICTSQNGQYIHVVWADKCSNRETIWYNRSENSGQTFLENPVALNPKWPFHYRSSQPRICCSQNGQTVYLVYRYGIADIVMRYSQDFGNTWSSSNDPENFFLEKNNRGRFTAKDPSIDCSDDGAFCHVAWQGSHDATASQERNYIFYRCWNRNTSSWTTANEVSCSAYAAGARWQKKPQIACTANGSNAYIVWTRYQDDDGNKKNVYFRYTTDYGATFLPANSELVSDTTTNNHFFPKLYCNRSNGNICVVWEQFKTSDPNSWQVKARARTAGAWQAIQDLSTEAEQNNKHYVLPAISGQGDNVYVTWVDFSTNPNQYVYFNSSNDCGTSWNVFAGSEISTPGTAPVYMVNWPSIGTNIGGDVYVVWGEKRGSSASRIFGRNPISKTSEEVLGNYTSRKLHGWNARLRANGKNVYALWLTDTHGGQDVFFNTSSDYGISWGNEFIVNQTSGEICNVPKLGVDDDNFVYIVWQKQSTAKSDLATSFGTGHLQGEKIQEVVFQQYYYGQGENSKNTKNRKLISGKSYEEKLDLRTKKSKIFRSQNVGSNVNVRNPIMTHNGEGIVYIFYENNEDYGYCRTTRYVSRDRGQTWESRGNLYFASYDEYFSRQILSETDYLYWVLQRRGSSNNSLSDIYFLRYSQYIGGASDVNTRIDLGDNENENTSQNPCMARDRNKILVAWTDFRSGNNPDIYFSYSLDRGMNWLLNAQPLTSNDAYGNGRVKVVAAEDIFYLVWSRYNISQKKYSVIFNYLIIDSDGNYVTGQEKQIDSNQASAKNPQIACDGDQVFITWEENENGNSNVYVRSSSDRGKNWNTTQRFNTNQTGRAIAPRMAIFDGWCYVIWEDYRLGKNIFFESRKIW